MALSKTQNNRLGLLLSVMFNEDTPEELLANVVKEGFVENLLKKHNVQNKLSIPNIY